MLCETQESIGSDITEGVNAHPPEGPAADCR